MPRRDGVKRFFGMTRKERKRRARNGQSWRDKNSPNKINGR